MFCLSPLYFFSLYRFENRNIITKKMTLMWVKRIQNCMFCMHTTRTRTGSYRFVDTCV